MQTAQTTGELSYEGRVVKEILIHSVKGDYDLSYQAPAWQKITVGLTVNQLFRVSYYEKGIAVKVHDFPAASTWVEVDYGVGQ